MKDLFPGYYRPNEQEFSELWQNCVFILDANVILNLYRYSEDTRKDFFNVLRKIENRLWIPHQVALEYQENRTTVIKSEERKFETIQQVLNEFTSDLQRQLHQFPSFEYKDLINNVDKAFQKFLEQLRPFEPKQLKSEEHDYIRDIIDDLFKGKIGNPPESKQELDEIYKEGEERYKIKYPPGFKDKDKAKEPPYLCNGMSFKKEYGDLILWKQILKEVQSQNLKNIIFVTDDDKEDWWRIEQGKTISVRPELVEEICKAGASSFYMYTSERFLKFAKDYIEVTIKEESIRQVEDIAELDRESVVRNEIYAKYQEIERAVLKWIESQYPNDDTFVRGRLSDSGVDILRLGRKEKNKIGYEINYVSRGKILQISLQTPLSRLLNNIHDENLNEAYLILVIDRLPKVHRVEAIKDFVTKSQEVKLPKNFYLVLGEVFLDKDTRKYIFNQLYIFGPELDVE